jgi:signal transduction histidine kinase
MLPTTPQPRPLDRRLRRMIILLVAAVFAGGVALRALDLAHRRTNRIAEGRVRTGTVAREVAEQLQSTFASADAVLRQMCAISHEVGGPAGDAARWDPVLQVSRTRANGLGSISILDRDGIVRFSTYAPLVGRNRRDTVLFRQAAASDGNELLTADAYESSSTPELMLLPLGRPLRTAQGEFDGMVWATFAPLHLARFLETIKLGTRGGICIFHPDGKVLFATRAANLTAPRTAAALWKLAQTATPGSTAQATLPGESSSRVLGFERAAQPGFLIVTARDGDELLDYWRREVWISIAVASVTGLALALGLWYIIREYEARRGAEAALIEARRLESLGRLTGGVAHDFNNLLTVITLNTSLLNLTKPSPEVAEIERAAGRAAELTRQLLTYARKQPLQPRPVNLADLVHGLQPMLARVLGEDIVVRVITPAGICQARLDTAGAENAIINLCINARDAMAGGGTLSLETRVVTIDPALARNREGFSPGQYAVLSVADTGVGIAPEHLPHLFEPFFTTKEFGKGTGLGLSSVHGFVMQSGGQITVESTVGQGTVVRLYFPAIDEAVTASAPRTEPAPAARRGRSVLLVEDEPSVRDVAALTLRQLGYFVHAAADGSEALALARRELQVDVLLTDVVLGGGMNGRQVADEIAKLRPGVRIVFASGYSDGVLHDRAPLPPGARLIQKPYDSQRLASALAEACRSM